MNGRGRRRVAACAVVGISIFHWCGAARAASTVFLEEHFSSGSYAGWSVTTPAGSAWGPNVVGSPEDFAIRGLGWGYGGLPPEDVRIGRPLAMNNIGELTIEMRARSGPAWPNHASVFLWSGGEYYRPMDFGENGWAFFQTRIGGIDEHVLLHPIADPHAWHTFKWVRDAAGWWSVYLDGLPEAINFTQDDRLTSFDAIDLQVVRDQSELDWVRVSGVVIPEPLTILTLTLAAGCVGRYVLKRKRAV